MMGYWHSTKLPLVVTRKYPANAPIRLFMSCCQGRWHDLRYVANLMGCELVESKTQLCTHSRISLWLNLQFKRIDANAHGKLKVKFVYVSRPHITIWTLIWCFLDTHETKLSTVVYFATHCAAVGNAIVIEYQFKYVTYASLLASSAS